jgi:diadenosine tetraphosphate (Ap4A) HIT family hydrolase
MTYDKGNIFAKIIRKEIPAKIVYEDENTLAFHDASPAAPVHILVVPKGDYISFDDFCTKADATRVSEFFGAIQKIALDQGIQKTGYRLITNHGTDASQSVPHFHVHILAGRSLGGLVPGDALRR